MSSVSSQADLCKALTAGWETVTWNITCRIGAVTTFNGTSVAISGNAFFAWTYAPDDNSLSTAISLRDRRVNALINNPALVLGTSFPGAQPNCGCYGTEPVTASNAFGFNYDMTIGGLSMQCGARLTYDPTNPAAILNQVGIDDGSSTSFSNLGKFCSTPAVLGGVLGVPGYGSCRQYGVVAGLQGSSQAIINSASGGVTVLDGSITRVDFVNGSPGSGYTSPPAIIVSPPNPLAVLPIFTLDSSAKPTGLATQTSTVLTFQSNGPYTAIPSGVLTGGLCVDVGVGGGIGAACTGDIQTIVDAANQSRTGRVCLSLDFSGPSACGPLGSKGRCISLIGTTINAVYFPGTGNTYCTSAPTLALASDTLQIPTIASISASLGPDGSISQLNIVNGGSGYRTIPSFSISAPATDGVGKLCSGNPIPSLPAEIALSTRVASGITATGQCRPLGRNTLTKKVCSMPSVAGGEWGTLNVYTCNVDSSFIAAPGSSVQEPCGVLPVSFTIVAPPDPLAYPSPIPTPTPTPSRTPWPSPKSPPPRPKSPSPRPSSPSFTSSTPSTSGSKNKLCTYDGVYRIESASCDGRYISYQVGTGDVCKNTAIQLRRGRQAPGPRIHWRLKARAVDGKVPNASSVVAVGRTESSCKTSGISNLAPNDGEGPVLKVSGSAWKLKIIPLDVSRDCNTVVIQSASGKNKGQFLGYAMPCHNPANFIWRRYTTPTNMKWKLFKVRS